MLVGGRLAGSCFGSLVGVIGGWRDCFQIIVVW